MKNYTANKIAYRKSAPIDEALRVPKCAPFALTQCSNKRTFHTLCRCPGGRRLRLPGRLRHREALQLVAQREISSTTNTLSWQCK
jgi:hypothetical protein